MPIPNKKELKQNCIQYTKNELTTIPFVKISDVADVLFEQQNNGEDLPLSQSVDDAIIFLKATKLADLQYLNTDDLAEFIVQGKPEKPPIDSNNQHATIQSIKFSNRMSSRGEFRGEILRDFFEEQKKRDPDNQKSAYDALASGLIDPQYSDLMTGVKAVLCGTLAEQNFGMMITERQWELYTETVFALLKKRINSNHLDNIDLNQFKANLSLQQLLWKKNELDYIFEVSYQIDQLEKNIPLLKAQKVDCSEAEACLDKMRFQLECFKEDKPFNRKIIKACERFTQYLEYSNYIEKKMGQLGEAATPVAEHIKIQLFACLDPATSNQEKQQALTKAQELVVRMDTAQEILDEFNTFVNFIPEDFKKTLAEGRRIDQHLKTSMDQYTAGKVFDANIIAESKKYRQIYSKHIALFKALKENIESLNQVKCLNGYEKKCEENAAALQSALITELDTIVSSKDRLVNDDNIIVGRAKRFLQATNEAAALSKEIKSDLFYPLNLEEDFLKLANNEDIKDTSLGRYKEIKPVRDQLFLLRDKASELQRRGYTDASKEATALFHQLLEHNRTYITGAMGKKEYCEQGKSLIEAAEKGELSKHRTTVGKIVAAIFHALNVLSLGVIKAYTTTSIKKIGGIKMQFQVIWNSESSDKDDEVVEPSKPSKS